MSASMIPPDDVRASAARTWAQAHAGATVTRFETATADASFRRYFRAWCGDRTWIVMDAPPQHEDCRPFVTVAALLAAAGVNAPRVIAQDLEQGFLLLTDMGTQTFLDVLNERNADTLFADATDALLRWQRATQAGVLPEYDDGLLRRELALFPDWYLNRHLRVALDSDERQVLQLQFNLLVRAALAQSQVYVHRDYMPRNLMVSVPNPGVLDFQDAVRGPLAYDVISLFKDAFLSWPEARVQVWLRRYWDSARAAGLPVAGDFAAFCRDCDWIGLQRHLKVLGIFARLTYRDGKPRYVADTPRFVRYVMEVLPRYPELRPLREMFERRVLPVVS